MGGMIIGATVTTVAIIFALVNVKDAFNSFHARLIPKAKPTTVRKVEIYKAVASSLKEQKLTWTLKFNVKSNRALNTPVITIGEDFFYIRTNEIKVVHQDLVTDLRERGYEVDIALKATDEVETITLTVKVK